MRQECGTTFLINTVASSLLLAFLKKKKKKILELFEEEPRNQGCKGLVTLMWLGGGIGGGGLLLKHKDKDGQYPLQPNTAPRAPSVGAPKRQRPECPRSFPHPRLPRDATQASFRQGMGADVVVHTCSEVVTRDELLTRG